MALTVTVRDGDCVSIGNDVLVQFIKSKQNNTFRLIIQAPIDKKISRHQTVGLPTPDKKIDSKSK